MTKEEKELIRVALTIHEQRPGKILPAPLRKAVEALAQARRTKKEKP